MASQRPRVKVVRSARLPLMDPATHFNNDELQLLTLDPAWARCALGLRTLGAWRFGHDANELRCQSLLKVWEVLEVRRKRLASGDTMELLHAIEFCAEENVPLPAWLAIAYRRAFNAFTRPGGAPTLDAVFHSKSLPTQTPAKAAAARIDWQLGGQLWMAVWEIAQKHDGMDSALDEVLAAKPWGVGKTKARRLIEVVEATHCELTGQDTLSRFWEKRRKGMTR